MSRIHIVGNSHVWTLLGWERHAARDSVGLEASAHGLSLVGIAITGATAHNLIETGSRTQANVKVMQFLATGDGPKDVLFVFGDIDVRNHIKDEVGLAETLDRYGSFISTVGAQPGIRRILVGSITGYHGVLPQPMTDLWNLRLMELCSHRGWTYVDLTTPGIGLGPVDDSKDQNHLGPDAQPLLLAAISSALDTGMSEGFDPSSFGEP